MSHPALTWNWPITHVHSSTWNEWHTFTSAPTNKNGLKSLPTQKWNVTLFISTYLSNCIFIECGQHFLSARESLVMMSEMGNSCKGLHLMFFSEVDLHALLPIVNQHFGHCQYWSLLSIHSILLIDCVGCPNGFSPWILLISSLYPPYCSYRYALCSLLTLLLDHLQNNETTPRINCANSCLLLPKRQKIDHQLKEGNLFLRTLSLL